MNGISVENIGPINPEQVLGPNEYKGLETLEEIAKMVGYENPVLGLDHLAQEVISSKDPTDINGIAMAMVDIHGGVLNDLNVQIDVNQLRESSTINLTGGITAENKKSAEASATKLYSAALSLLEGYNPAKDHAEEWIKDNTPDDPNLRAILTVLVEKKGGSVIAAESAAEEEEEEKEKEEPITVEETEAFKQVVARAEEAEAKVAELKAEAEGANDALVALYESKIEKLSGIDSIIGARLDVLLARLRKASEREVTSLMTQIDKLLKPEESAEKVRKQESAKVAIQQLENSLPTGNLPDPTLTNTAYKDATPDQQGKIIIALTTDAVKRSLSMGEVPTTYEDYSPEIQAAIQSTLMARGAEIGVGLTKQREQIADNLYAQQEAGVYLTESDALKAANGDQQIEDLLQAKFDQRKVDGIIKKIEEGDLDINDARGDIMQYGTDAQLKIFNKKYAADSYEKVLQQLRDPDNNLTIDELKTSLRLLQADEYIPDLLKQAEAMDVGKKMYSDDDLKEIGALNTENNQDFSFLWESIVKSKQYQDLPQPMRRNIETEMEMSRNLFEKSILKEIGAVNLAELEAERAARKQKGETATKAIIYMKRYWPIAAGFTAAAMIPSAAGFLVGASTIGAIGGTIYESNFSTTAQDAAIEIAKLGQEIIDYEAKIDLATKKKISTTRKGIEGWAELAAAIAEGDSSLEASAIADELKRRGMGGKDFSAPSDKLNEMNYGFSKN